MNTHNDYFSELLSLYTDGQLPETEQQVLFAELTRNSALREELSQCLLIRSTLRSNRTIPPASLRNAVFARVGATSATPAIPVVHTLAQGWRIPLISFVAGAVMMFVLNGFIVGSNDGNDTLTTVAPTIGSTALTESKGGFISSGEQAIPEREAPRTRIVRRQAAHSASLHRQYSLKALPEDQTLSMLFDAHHTEGIEENNTPAMRVLTPPSLLEPKNTPPDFSSPVAVVNPATASLPSQTGREQGREVSLAAEEMLGRSVLPFSIELRGFMLRSFPNFGLVGLIDPPVNNVAVLAQWNMNKQWAFGAEAGQETILQEFNVTDGRNTTVYRQNHLGVWGGVNAQYILYTPDEASFFSISPVLRGTLGATRMGPMARLTAGAFLRVNERADLALGLESALFAYQYNSTWHSTTKLGTTLGLQIHF